MKRILLSTCALFIFCALAVAQETQTENVQKNFIGLTAGPSFPIGDFSSTDLNNEHAGAAKTGFTIDLKYGYLFNNIVGITLDANYGRYSFDKSILEDGAAVRISPWEYYNIMAGPMLTASIAPKANLDFAVLTGAAFVKSPQAKENGTVDVASDWATTMPLKFNVDFRFGFAGSGVVFAGADYLYMRPKFNVNTIVELPAGASFHQPMSLFGLHAGIGFGF